MRDARRAGRYAARNVTASTIGTTRSSATRSRWSSPLGTRPRSKLAGADARHQSERQADKRQHQALPQHHPQHGGAVGADRHADADLPRAPARRVRDQTVEADDREAQSHQPIAPTMVTSTLKMLIARIR